MAYTTIDNPFKYFNTVLYTGNATARTITTGLETTDWIWNKRRDNSGSHLLYDKVRGVNKDLNSDNEEAEETQVGTVTAFGTDNFTLGTHGGTNANGETKANWCWSAGGTTGSSNSDGDITSTVSANTTAGFSIVSFTGNGSSNQQVGHGLAATPTCYITKDRTNGSTNWHYHTTQIDGGMDFGNLNNGNAFSSSSLSAPSSTTIRVGGTINTSSANFISYVFAEKKGYSKFGSYTGNGNADGTFLYTGFKPAFFMIKRTTGSGYNWLLYDNKRQTSFNVIDDFLFPDTNDAETTGNANQSLDFLSNGVKHRGNGASSNASGVVFIYMAFAEAPFVTSGTKAPGTAR
mgnify:FL=1